MSVSFQWWVLGQIYSNRARKQRDIQTFLPRLQPWDIPNVLTTIAAMAYGEGWEGRVSGNCGEAIRNSKDV